MVNGLDIFKEYFKGYEEQYVLIGGTAINNLMFLVYFAVFYQTILNLRNIYRFLRFRLLLFRCCFITDTVLGSTLF